MSNTPEIEAKVLKLLEDFQKDTQNIAILRYKIENTPRVTPEEMIATMNFAHSDDGPASAGHISDKTFYIMLNYQNKTDAANRELNSNNTAVQLWEMEQERDRLLLYISLLEPRQAEVIRLYYMERLPRSEIAASLHVAVRTVHKLRKQAVDRLCEMYELSSD